MGEFQAMNKKQIAAHPDINVSVKTLTAWLKPFKKEIGPVNGKLYTPKQVKIIFSLLR
jgi:hypothetical protein